jgi:hypothetical protein
MVKVILLASASGKKRFFWNLDANVGVRSVNTDEDVALVQLGYFFMAQNGQGGPAEREIFSQITPGEAYGGREDEPLTKAIRAHQRTRGGTQDGHVSVITTKTGLYVDATGQHTYMLIPLVNNISDGDPDVFPRIDKLGDLCPAVLRTAVVRECLPPPVQT